MSEKRFWFVIDKGKLDYVQDNVTCEKITISELEDLLNGLVEENEKLKNKLNVTALELVDEGISMGKAVEISEMNYHEFLEYRKKKGKPMELQR